MQDDQDASMRWLVAVMRDICRRRGITLRTFSGDWVMELEKDDTKGRVLGSRFGLNNGVAAGIAQDKVAAYEVLNAAGVPAIPHILMRVGSPSFGRELHWKNGVVVKPLLGWGGRNVRLFYDQTGAENFMEHSGMSPWALSPLLSLQREIRIIILDEMVLLAYEKQPVVLHGLKVFNLSFGATPREYTPTAPQVDLAIKTQRALGLRLLAVDIAVTEAGELMVLEANDSIAMKKYSSFSKVNEDRAKNVYETIIEALLNQSKNPS